MKLSNKELENITHKFDTPAINDAFDIAHLSMAKELLVARKVIYFLDDEVICPVKQPSLWSALMEYDKAVAAL